MNERALIRALPRPRRGEDLVAGIGDDGAVPRPHRDDDRVAGVGGDWALQ